MCSLQQGDELVFQIPCVSNSKQENTRTRQNQDHIGVGQLRDHDPSATTSGKRPRDSPLTIIDQFGRSREHKESRNDDGEGTDNMKKKRLMMHREMERQRRQDMAKLYSSLRSLLPLQFIKGKRSISDHMQQAVNYIKEMHRNIKLLTVKRDKLKNITTSTAALQGSPMNYVNGSIRSNNSDQPAAPPKSNTVSISSSAAGIEILINCGCMDAPGFLLSRLLKLVSHEGLEVVSCTSTKVNDRLLHTIYSQVPDHLACIHLSILQQKLSDVLHI